MHASWEAVSWRRVESGIHRGKKRIASSYRADKKLADDYLSTLTNTQRGWLKYRDGQCKLEAFDAEEGSIAHEVATNICIVRINKERLELLRQIPY